MNKRTTFFSILTILGLMCSNALYAQKEISAEQPTDGARDVNVGVIKWSAQLGLKYDLYFGISENPSLYRADLDSMEVKPVVLELNRTYYWKIAEKKNGKTVRMSKTFTFSTLPIALNASVKYNSFVDLRDYKVYWTTTVGGAEWFAQNLDYKLPNNSWYYNDSETDKVYGQLYKGQLQSTQPHDVCPSGWHIPSQQEWETLINAFGGYKTAGAALKETSDTHWRNSKASKTNHSGMTVLPAGSRDSKPSFANKNKYTFFWTSSPNPKIPNSFSTIDLGFMRDNLIIEAGNPNWSYSIRCVKDK